MKVEDMKPTYVPTKGMEVKDCLHEIDMEAARERCKTCDADVAGHDPYNCQILKSTHSCKFIEEM